MNVRKRLDSIHDLTKGEREYLKRQGIRAELFDRMPLEEQQEWKESVQQEEYRDMLDFNKHVKQVKPYQI